MHEDKSHCVGVHAWCRALSKTIYRCKYIHGASKSDLLELCSQVAPQRCLEGCKGRRCCWITLQGIPVTGGARKEGVGVGG